MVVVLGRAADVGRPALTGERVQGADAAKELEGAVRRREPQPGGGAARAGRRHTSATIASTNQCRLSVENRALQMPGIVNGGWVK